MLKWFKSLKPSVIEQLGPQEVQTRVKQGATLIDVREKHERNVLYIPASKSEPLSSLKSRVNTLNNDKDIILYCNTGRRSQMAAKILAANKLNASNLTGGIQNWQAAGLSCKGKLTQK